MKSGKTPFRWKRSVWITLGVVVILLGYLTLLLVQESRYFQRDRDLIAAIKSNDTEKAIALLDAGADANALDLQDKSNHFREILSDFWQRRHDKLRQSSAGQHDSAIMVLLRYDFDKDGPVSPENPEMLGSMLRHGANANARNANLSTPLYLAVKYNYRRCVGVLLDYG